MAHHRRACCFEEAENTHVEVVGSVIYDDHFVALAASGFDDADGVIPGVEDGDHAPHRGHAHHYRGEEALQLVPPPTVVTLCGTIAG